jgi:hypothetical protein
MPFCLCFNCKATFEVGPVATVATGQCSVCKTIQKIYKCFSCMKISGLDPSDIRFPQGCPRCGTLVRSDKPLPPRPPKSKIPAFLPAVDTDLVPLPSLPRVVPMVDLCSPQTESALLIAPSSSSSSSAVVALPVQENLSLLNVCELYRAAVLKYIQENRGQDLSDVSLVVIPPGCYEIYSRVWSASGGLFVNSTGANKIMMNNFKGLCKEKHGDEHPFVENITPGKTVLIASNMDFDTDKDRLKICWILWHEFGHAFTEKTKGAKDAATEPPAWLFEIESIRDGLKSGVLQRLGFTAKMASEMLATRAETFTGKGTKDAGSKLIPTIQERYRELKELIEKLMKG